MIFLSSILAFNACTHIVIETQLAPPPPDAKLVGKVLAGALTFEPNEDPKGNYLVATPAYVQYYFYLQLTAKEMELEISRLKAKLNK
jgi:hypothetical protein